MSNIRTLLLGIAVCALVLPALPARGQEDEILPKHIDKKTQLAIQKGLKFLANSQSDNGSWESFRDGATYPTTMTSLAGMAFLSNGNTTSRGPYADQVHKASGFVMAQSGDYGLIADRREIGMSMYGHGFSLLFLSCAYGMETDAEKRKQMSDVLKAGILLTSRGQSQLGGWTYTPGSGDEGSVTVTQMQGLRAAHNAGLTVPKGTIKAAIKYLEACRGPEGGIVYSYASGGGSRLPISAAAITCLYSAGEYESPLAEQCLKYVTGQFKRSSRGFSVDGGHDFYTHLYASQAFYQAGDEYWDDYFPKAREQLLKRQQKDGSWVGDGVGPVYGTAIALIVLQLPYKYLPIYQR